MNSPARAPKVDFAVIGGSGLYALSGLEVMERRDLDTPWGKPSAAVVIGRFAERTVAFLARHGEDHQLAPHGVNYRANLWVLQHIGVNRVIGVNAVGGIRADMAPRAMAVPDQIIDYTWGRPSSFGDADGAAVRHVDFSEPYTASLRRTLLVAAERAGIEAIDGGCYGVTQGPRLETCAEIKRMQRDGCDLVGMTGMPEAVLARELGVDYACLALVANWAAGCDPQQGMEISIEEIFAHLSAATAKVPDILQYL